MNKKALSMIVGSVILIALTIVAVAVVWSFVRGFVDSKLENAGSCLDVIDKIEFNSDFTCFDNELNRVLFSISRKNANISSAIVVIAQDGSSTSFEFTEDGVTPDDETLSGYSDSGDVSLPSINSGKTYIYKGNFSTSPDSVFIAPVVGDRQCESTDKIEELPICSEIGL